MRHMLTEDTSIHQRCKMRSDEYNRSFLGYILPAYNFDFTKEEPVAAFACEAHEGVGRAEACACALVGEPGALHVARGAACWLSVSEMCVGWSVPGEAL